VLCVSIGTSTARNFLISCEFSCEFFVKIRRKQIYDEFSADLGSHVIPLWVIIFREFKKSQEMSCGTIQRQEISANKIFRLCDNLELKICPKPHGHKTKNKIIVYHE
jgi:hypothetical protein